MAYKRDSRNLGTLFPDSISKYVSEEDPVRVYDEFVELLDLTKLGITLDSNKKGASSYNPKTLLKVLVYSYSYGWRSSRKIERALHHNLSYIWLAGGQKPDHKTINRFRRKNKKALKEVLLMCARVCYDLKLISGNTLFVDGSKFRANAGLNKSKTLEGWKSYKGKVELRIIELLKQVDELDKEDKQSMVKVQKQFMKANKIKQRIDDTLAMIEQENLAEKTGYGKKQVAPKINSTDKESKVMKGRQGSHPSYNIQMATDLKNGLILSTEATSDVNDLNNLSPTVKRAEQVTSQKSKIVCADAGYSSIKDIAKIASEERMIIVPNPKAKEVQENKFHRDHFEYDEQRDLYICPAGKELAKKKIKNTEGIINYSPKQASTCQQCEHFANCTNSKVCRSIARTEHEDLKKKIKEDYASESGQKIYELRKQTVEHQFGHIKKNMGLGQFLLRGKEGANAEISIAATCYNITRMTNIIGGVIETINRLRKLPKLQ